MMINVSEALDNRLGIDLHEEASDPHAGMWGGTRALTAEEQQWLAAQGDVTYQRFLKRVADARGMTISDADQVAQGRVWSGEDALSRGLVDVLGGLDTAVNMAGVRAGIDASSATIVRLPKKKTLLEALSSRMEGASVQLAQLGRSPERIAVDEGLQTLAAIRSHHGRPMARMPYTPIIR
jgi:protease-4